MSAENVEWIIPDEGWPFPGVRRGPAGSENLLKRANEEVEISYSEPQEIIAQKDRVLVIGSATGRTKSTNKTFVDYWVFDITVRNGKVKNIRKYIDIQALARSSEVAA